MLRNCMRVSFVGLYNKFHLGESIYHSSLYAMYGTCRCLDYELVVRPIRACQSMQFFVITYVQIPTDFYHDLQVTWHNKSTLAWRTLELISTVCRSLPNKGNTHSSGYRSSGDPSFIMLNLI